MNGRFSEAEGKGEPYTAQPTAPSREQTKARVDDALCICWFGPNAEWVELKLTDARLRIGREPGNDLVLRGTEVSRNHAEIAKESGQFSILDVGSRNGVLVNGTRQRSAVLAEGAVLRLGEWIGLIRRGSSGRFGEVAPRLWGSAELERALQPLRLAARSPLNLIIAGDTGTGKELVARAVFEWSGLSGAFVPVNCAALSESILETELFGHVRGAFTGAVTDRLGHLRESDGGLLFLDEIGELSLLSQGKLLRVLQEQEVTPVGTSKRIALRLRVVAATHRNLHQMVKAGAFRLDLLTRLEGLLVRLPSLSDRREDILPMFLAFVRARLDGRAPALTPELSMSLALSDWPGNVRELKQLADRAAVLHGEKPTWGLAEVDLQPESGSCIPEPESPEPTGPGNGPRKRVGRHELTAALAASQGVVAQAARSLRMSKQTLYRQLDEHAIDVKVYRDPKRRSQS
ncbi:MAG: sigma 54-interacting transcriptional regulator [Pseudomonadota bacterium]